MNYMSAAEFVEKGFLQEVNRRLLHPCGLALEVVVKDGHVVGFGGVWDCRDDPEGIMFAASDPPDWKKRNRVNEEWNVHVQPRWNAMELQDPYLGQGIQPCPEPGEG